MTHGSFENRVCLDKRVVDREFAICEHVVGGGVVHVISRKKLREFWEQHADAERPLASWFKVASKAQWASLVELRQTYPTADSVGKFTVFNIGGNKYRLITEINFHAQRVYIRHVLSHADYDRARWRE